MHMLLQKTILKINVADIDVRFDKPTQARFAELARGKAYSDGLEQLLALVAIDAARAVVQMQFKRDIPLNRWIGVVRDNLEEARKAGLITRDVEQRVGEALPRVVRRPQRSRLREGRPADLLGQPDAVRSVVVSTSGQVLVDIDRARSGRAPGRAGQLLRARERVPRAAAAVAVRSEH